MTKFIIRPANSAFLRQSDCHRRKNLWWRMWGYHCRDCAQHFGAEV